MKQRGAACLTAGWLLVGAAGASTVIALNLNSLSRQAEVIVLGRCRHASVHWNADRTRIYTDWTVAVAQAVKGTPGEQVIVRQLGGELDGIGLMVSGAVRMSAGEEVILFLRPAEEGVYRVLGLSQGHYRVHTDAVSGAKWVTPAAQPRPGAERGQIPLEEFLGQVRKAAGEAQP